MLKRMWRCLSLLLVAHLAVVMPAAAQPTVVCADAENCCRVGVDEHACCAPQPTSGAGVHALVESLPPCAVVTHQPMEITRATPRASIEVASLIAQTTGAAAPQPAAGRFVQASDSKCSHLRFLTGDLAP